MQYLSLSRHLSLSELLLLILKIRNQIGLAKKQYLQFFLIVFNFFTWLCQVLLVACGIFNLHCGMRNLQFWHVVYSSLTRDQNQTPCIGNLKSQPLDHQRGLRAYQVLRFYLALKIMCPVVCFPFVMPQLRSHRFRLRDVSPYRLARSGLLRSRLNMVSPPQCFSYAELADSLAIDITQLDTFFKTSMLTFN